MNETTAYGITLNSTLLFLARPSLVLLSAIGFSLPYPLITIRFAGIWNLSWIYFLAFCALFSEMRWLAFSDPPESVCPPISTRIEEFSFRIIPSASSALAAAGVMFVLLGSK